LRLELKIVSWPTYMAEVSQKGRSPMSFFGWSMDFPDPSDFFEPILSSSAIQEEGSQNAPFFANPELDQLLRDAHHELDPVERRRLYRRCEQIVADQAPWALGFDYRYYELTQPYVHGYVTEPAHTQYLREVWIDQEQKR
jgi:ABC-type transport system substrate-binding protein